MPIHTHNGKANHKMADAHQRGQITNDVTEAITNRHKQSEVCNHNTHARTINANATNTTTTRDAERKEDNERENRTGHECLTFLQTLLHLHETSYSRVCVCVCDYVGEYV